MSRLGIILLIWKLHQYHWRAVKFTRPMLGALYMSSIGSPSVWRKRARWSDCYGFWEWRDVYRATPVTQSHGFCRLIRRTAPFSRLLQKKSFTTRWLLSHHNAITKLVTRCSWKKYLIWIEFFIKFLLQILQIAVYTLLYANAHVCLCLPTFVNFSETN